QRGRLGLLRRYGRGGRRRGTCRHIHGHVRRRSRERQPLGELATGDGVAHDQMVLRTDGPPNRWSSEQMVLRTDGPPNRWSSEQMVLRTDGPPASFEHEDPPSVGYEGLKSLLGGSAS